MSSIVFLLISTAIAVSGAPCDIYASAGTPCVAAFATTRALFSSYLGPLYEVRRVADNATLNISSLPSGFADAAAQDTFCGDGAPPSSFPSFGTIVSLLPASTPTLSFRHCNGQGFVTPNPPGPLDDHFFTLVAALNGEAGAVSFRSVNFPEYYIAPIMGAEPGRVGIFQAPAAADASWAVAPAAAGGGFTFECASRAGQFLSVGSNLTGVCASEYRAPSANVYLGTIPTYWILSTGDSCVISRIFDQSARANHLDPGPGGGAAPNPDKPVGASSFNVTVGGGAKAKVYGAYFKTGMGYRRDNTDGIAKGDDPETLYAVMSGTVFNDGCCMDFGNAEADNHDDGAGTMESVYVGGWNATRSGWCGGAGSPPWVMADLENGLWACEKEGAINPLATTQSAEFVTGLVKGKPGEWAIKAGNATGGPLATTFVGPRPRGYSPMRKQGAIILGIGGDNSNSAIGVFFEGVMTAGYSDDATDDDVQKDIVSVYGQ
jgi:hypothetical protein